NSFLRHQLYDGAKQFLDVERLVTNRVGPESARSFDARVHFIAKTGNDDRARVGIAFAGAAHDVATAAARKLHIDDYGIVVALPQPQFGVVDVARQIDAQAFFAKNTPERLAQIGIVVDD